jgi:hypothetical protein
MMVHCNCYFWTLSIVWYSSPKLALLRSQVGIWLTPTQLGLLDRNDCTCPVTEASSFPWSHLRKHFLTFSPEGANIHFPKGRVPFTIPENGQSPEIQEQQLVAFACWRQDICLRTTIHCFDAVVKTFSCDILMKF